MEELIGGAEFTDAVTAHVCRDGAGRHYRPGILTSTGRYGDRERSGVVVHARSLLGIEVQVA